jgi:Mrr N-terminal domain/SeqA protein N-terminal domain
MTSTIEIDDDLFELLKRHAEPFVDTPSDVLRRLLDGLPKSMRAKQVGSRALSATGAPARRRNIKGKKDNTRKGSVKHRRAPSSALLSERAYERPLLDVLDAAGGRLPTREAIAAVGERVVDQLMPMDHDVMGPGQERWESRVQFTRLRLVETGLLEKNSPRGVWEISDAGREHLKRTATVAA